MDRKKPTTLERLARIRADSDFLAEGAKVLIEAMVVHREINAKLAALHARSGTINHMLGPIRRIDSD